MEQFLRDQVARRAAGRCEYCRMPESLDPMPFEVDHIKPRKHGGQSLMENLAWACFPCNRHKGPNPAGYDPLTGKLVNLFDPRRDAWEEHFQWQGPELIGQTPTGRVTVEVLLINHSDRVAVRRDLILEAQFPGTTQT